MSERFLDALLTAGRRPLKKLQLLINSFNTLHFVTEDQGRRYRDKWATVLARNPELFIGVTLVDEVSLIQFEAICRRRTFPVHELVFPPFVRPTARVLNFVENRFAETLIKLSLHAEMEEEQEEEEQEEEEEEEQVGEEGRKSNDETDSVNHTLASDGNNVNNGKADGANAELEEAIVHLARACRQLNKLTVAFKFKREFVQRLLLMKGSRLEFCKDEEEEERRRETEFWKEVLEKEKEEKEKEKEKEELEEEKVSEEREGKRKRIEKN